MNPNLAAIISTAAIVILDGQTFRPKAGITIKPIRSTFDVTMATVGIAERRINEVGAEISFVPDGKTFTGLETPVLHPYMVTDLGDTLAARLRIPCASITTATDIITKTAHGLASGTPVMISYTSIAPTVTGGFPRGTTLYVRATTANTLTLHTTEAGALGDGTVAKVDFTAQGTGSVILSRMRTLVIHSTLGVKVTFHNVCVTTLPNLRFSAGETLFQSITIRAFHKQGVAPGVDTMFTISEATFADTGFDATQIRTATPTVSWGAAAPWTDLPVGSSVEVDFSLQTAEIEGDAARVIGLRFLGVSATIKVNAHGLTWAETMDRLQVTEARGAKVEPEGISVSNGAFYFTAVATLEPPDLMADPAQNMVGALTFNTIPTQTDGIVSAWYAAYLD